MYTAIMNDLQTIETDYADSLAESVEYTKQQVAFKLSQLEGMLSKTQQSNKQDKMSMLIQTMIASF